MKIYVSFAFLAAIVLIVCSATATIRQDILYKYNGIDCQRDYASAAGCCRAYVGQMIQGGAAQYISDQTVLKDGKYVCQSQQ